VGAETEEFVLALNGKPVHPLEEQGRGDISEMLCSQLEDAVLFLLPCMFFFPQPLSLSLSFMFLTFCTFFFFFITPFFPLLSISHNTSNFRFCQKAVSRTCFSCSYHLASVLYLLYKY